MLPHRIATLADQADSHVRHRGMSGRSAPDSGPCHHGSVDVGKLLNDLCVVYGYCLPPDDQERIIADPPQTIDAFTDAVIIAEGLDPVRMDADSRRELRRMVAAAFGEPVSPVAPRRRASWSERGHRD